MLIEHCLQMWLVVSYFRMPGWQCNPVVIRLCSLIRSPFYFTADINEESHNFGFIKIRFYREHGVKIELINQCDTLHDSKDESVDRFK